MSRQKVTPLPRQDMYSSRLPVYPGNHDNDRQNNDNDSGFSQRDDSFNKQPQQDEESRNRRRRPQFSPDSGDLIKEIIYLITFLCIFPLIYFCDHFSYHEMENYR